MSRGRPVDVKRVAIVESLRGRNLTQRQIAQELRLSAADVKHTVYRELQADPPQIIQLPPVRVEGCARPVAQYTAVQVFALGSMADV